jgi:hypothetical protein
MRVFDETVNYSSGLMFVFNVLKIRSRCVSLVTHEDVSDA